MVQTEYRFKTRPALALVLPGAVALALAASTSADADPRSEFQKLLEEQRVASPTKIALLDSMPEDVRCDSVAANGSRIAITCTANGYDTLHMFYENLTDTQYFDDVGLDRAACVAVGVQFEMSFRIGPASPALQSADPDPRSEFQKLLEEQGVASPAKIALLDSMPGPVRCLFSQQPNPPIKTALLESMPVHVRVRRVGASSSNIAISGAASGYDAIWTFYNNLEGSKYFDDVTLGNTFRIPGGIQFSLNVRLRTPN